MKRSDLVKRLSDELCSFFPNMDLNKRNLIADFCIDICEEEGMSPPEYNANEGSGIKRSYMVNEWEDE